MSDTLGRLRRRPTVCAAALYLLLAIAFVSPALMPGKVMSNSDSLWFGPPWDASIPASLERPANPEVGDAPEVLFPFGEYAKRRLPDVALWNPHVQGGRPFMADMQSAIFAPFSVPSYVLPFYESLAVVAALKLFLAAFGTYLLAAALGMRFGGALVAGIVFGFNLWLVTWLVYPHSSVWALLPLLLWSTERLVRRPQVGPMAALAAVGGAVLLCGHPESALHAFLAAGALLVLRLAQARREQRTPPLRPLLAFLGAAVGAVGLAAVALVPFVELLLRSADLAQRAGAGDDQVVERRFLLMALMPDYWGRPTGTPLEPFMLSRAFFGGVLALMLAAAALIQRPRLERLAVAGFGAVCLAIVVGAPGLFDVVTALPPFSSGHNTRLAILALLCLALLAGWGLDDLAERRPSRVVLGVAAGVVLLPAAWVLLGGKTSLAVLGRAAEVGLLFATPPGIGDPELGEVVRLASLLAFLAIAGSGAVLLVLRGRGRLGAGAFVALATALCAIDLLRVGMGYNPAIDERVADQPPTGAVSYLQRRRPARFVSTGKTRGIPQNVIPMRFGLFEARGYDLPVERRYDRLWRREVSPELPSQVGPYVGFIPLSLPRVSERRLRTLSLLGVGDVVQPAGDPPLRLPGLSPAYRGADATVYRNSRALPRAWLVDRLRPAASEDEALAAVTSPSFEPRHEAVVEGPRAPLPRASAGPDGEPAARAVVGAVGIERYGAERVELRARAARPAMLVLSDLHYPGWKAKLDGREVPIERVNYLMRGVRLPPGAHRVQMTYAPLSFRIGWIVSLLALAALVVTAVAARLRRRR